MSYEKRVKQRKIKLGDISPSNKQGKSFDIEVEAEELRLIAERLKLPSLQSLRAEGHIKQMADVPIYKLEGSVIAEATLLCTVSLEEFSTRFDEPLQWDLSRDRRYKPGAGIAESPNHPEYVEDKAIDPIEYAIQTLGLNIPPYPRREGADLNDWQKHGATAEMLRKGWLTFDAATHTASGGGERKPQAPFAALAELKNKLKAGAKS